VAILLQKTNADWWNVRRANGQDGYVPANYVKEIEPKVMQKKTKKPVVVPVKVMVTKTGYKKEMQTRLKPKKKKKGSSKVRRTPSRQYFCRFPSLIVLYMYIVNYGQNDSCVFWKGNKRWPNCL
jgi:hypothetical protein